MLVTYSNLSLSGHFNSSFLLGDVLLSLVRILQTMYKDTCIRVNECK